MAILKKHIPFYREIFNLPSFFSEPLLILGYQDIYGKNIPHDYDFPDMKALLENKGLKDIDITDLFDERANHKHDFNCTIPKEEYEKYGTIIDVGTLEHIFDTRQALENCMRMVKVGGHFFLHTPVRGYYYHGFHTFSPELITEAFKLNGFTIVYVKYSSSTGIPLKSPWESLDVIIWTVARKEKSMEKFIVPHQKFWVDKYQNGVEERSVKRVLPFIRSVLLAITPPIFITIAKGIRTKLRSLQ